MRLHTLLYIVLLLDDEDDDWHSKVKKMRRLHVNSRLKGPRLTAELKHAVLYEYKNVHQRTEHHAKCLTEGKTAHLP